MVKNIRVDQLSWEPHPIFKDLLVKKLLTYEKDKVDLSIVMVKVKRGSEIPAHVHEQDDIVYHLEGKGRMWVEGVGDFMVSEGSGLAITHFASSTYLFDCPRLRNKMETKCSTTPYIR